MPNFSTTEEPKPRRIGIAADHGGFELKQHQGVEDDDLNIICLGGLVVGHALAWELVQTFLAARFSGAERHSRRLAKVAELERRPPEETP
jgi:ribose 5-phosphate isomerase RpiB